MSTILPTCLEDCFGDLSDPRVEGCCDHQGLDILLIAIGGMLCGVESGIGIETAKASGFRQFLSLEHGIRSHDTFGSGFAKIVMKRFKPALCAEWRAFFG